MNLTISSFFFRSYSYQNFFKIKLNVTTSSSSASKELILKINQSPLNGTCELNTITGVSFVTNFTVKCSDWVDADGLIYSYSFYG
jgi:hypothetical protein